MKPYLPAAKISSFSFIISIFSTELEYVMNTFTVMNLILIGLLIFTALLVWSRNWKRKQAYLERIKRNPETFVWLGNNLSGVEIKDLKAVADRFALPMLQAKQLIEFYKQEKNK